MRKITIARLSHIFLLKARVLDEEKTEASLSNYHLVDAFLVDEKITEYRLTCDLLVKVGVVGEDKIEANLSYDHLLEASLAVEKKPRQD